MYRQFKGCCVEIFSVSTRNDLREAAPIAVKLGATTADTQFGGDWITLIDLAGNPFCFVCDN